MTKTIILMLIAFVLASTATTIIYYELNKPSYQYIYTDLLVSHERHMSFDHNTTSLRFARLPPGSIGKKQISLENGKDHAVKTFIYSTGNISPFLSYSIEEVVMHPGMHMNLSITATVPENAVPEMHYEGNIILKSVKI